MALKDGTHIAVDHEDTSEGAIHSFQVIVLIRNFIEFLAIN